MPIQVRGVLVHTMSATKLSRVQTEFRLRLPEPIHKSPLESRGPTLLCNHVKSVATCVEEDFIRLCDRFIGVSRFSEGAMRQVLAVFLGLVFVASSLPPQKPASQPAPQAGLDTATAELVALTNSWTDAIDAKDHTKLEALMAPEFALYRWNGEVLAPRPAWLDYLDHTEIKEYTVRNVSARVYGEFAVVTSVCTWAGVHDDHPFNFNSIMVDTWRRMDRKWQVVARNSCSPTPTSASTPSPCSR
jgi:ketosteroid isomerase-like protein